MVSSECAVAIAVGPTVRVGHVRNTLFPRTIKTTSGEYATTPSDHIATLQFNGPVTELAMFGDTLAVNVGGRVRLFWNLDSVLENKLDDVQALPRHLEWNDRGTNGLYDKLLAGRVHFPEKAVVFAMTLNRHGCLTMGFWASIYDCDRGSYRFFAML
jgi:hypothetical protein